MNDASVLGTLAVSDFAGAERRWDTLVPKRATHRWARVLRTSKTGGAVLCQCKQMGAPQDRVELGTATANFCISFLVGQAGRRVTLGTAPRGFDMVSFIIIT